MKKLVLVLLLVAFIAVGAFANDPRPDGFGIGIVGGSTRAWDDGVGFSTGDLRYGLALAFADAYWGVRLGGTRNALWVGVTCDFLTLMGGTFGGGPVGFYIDGGLFANVVVGGDILYVGGGARLPIGLNFNFDIVDLWLAVVPSIGVHVGIGDGGGIGIGGGWGPEIGLRVWF